MTMTIDANQQRYGHLQFDNMSSYPTHSPQFSNPWASSTTAPSSHALYVASQPGLASNPMGLDRHAQQPPSRAPATTTAPLAPYGSVPVTSASAGSPLSMVDPSLAGGQSDLLSLPQDLLSINRMPHPSSAPSYAESAYTTAASPVHATYAASPTSYDSMGYPSSSVRHNFGLAPDADPHRRYSQSSVSSGASYDHQVEGLPPVPRSSLVDFRSDRGINDDRRSFQDAIEASHGMLSMKFDTSNQETPRAGVYNNRGRASGDSYGFPSAHSTSSSVSSTGFSPYYGSVDGSVSDYSTAGSDIESVGGSRTLPRPQGLMPNQPPAPQSMMGQFSSKVSSSTQKKHKCKVCDKRFTRPSSLQTHMYSHTGEKPFKCEVENCGRHFSVVSNLRRHRKVHKGDARSDAGSEDHQSD